MAKQGKSFRSAESQAQFAVRKLQLDSQGTERNYQQALKGFAEFLKERGFEKGLTKELTRETAELYLTVRSQEVGQKTLDLDRQALQAVLKDKLPVVKSEQAQVLSSRAYTREQTERVAAAQTEKHGLATLIAQDAGLRAHELLTLKRADERPADTHRQYRLDRFTGRSDIVKYTVEGKGGLCREVALSKALSDKLESRRLEAPKTVYDRDIGYRQYYDIGGGKKWSDSFSKASTRELGWSNGAHGVRHEYAQSRVNELQSNGFIYKDALEIVSQEMGHFRPEITEVYLR